jgi:cyclohexanone monooxygenase
MTSRTIDESIDVVVVGAGFGGLYMLHKLRSSGLRVFGFERGEDVGGTWYWNRYPGARCDVESMDYSYGFDEALQQEWGWTERYATQPEILAYLNHVADRFDLRPLIRFNTTVVSAHWDEPALRWHIEAEGGEHVSARFLILATGSLSAAKEADIPGLDDFSGTVLRTSDWPAQGATFAGQRVGVIGTGSSAIQAVPLIAQSAAHLTVFQRTPTFTIPAHNAPLSQDAITERKATYGEHRRRARETSPGVVWPASGLSALEVDAERRRKIFEAAWEYGGAAFSAAFTDFITDDRANETAADFVRGKIREIVADAEVAERLCPKTFPIGSKRLAVDTDYYATFNRSNVTLKDVRATPIVGIEREGIRTSEDLTRLDVIVLAIGFDAMTGSFLKIDVRGVEAGSLRDAWAAGPRTYLGLMASGFPNMFMVAGPGSPSVLSNMVLSIEQHVEWIDALIAYMGMTGLTRAEAATSAQDAWVARLNALAARTLYMKGDSWYLGANVPGKPRVFMPFVGGVRAYREICDLVASERYKELELR